ncbi:MAG TPA: GNAT family N-acetyltransferase [Rickettsiales bacterium]|nr:GNAT family N-acetyltransferase [Rickettsiales bacterium]
MTTLIEKPIPINSQFILTEFAARDEAELLRIAKMPGFVYSGLNAYSAADGSRMSVEDNVHTYLHDEALLAQTQEPRRTMYLAIRERASGKVVGAIEFMGGEHERDGQAELAYFISPEHQGKGLATLAGAIAIEKALKMGIKPLWSEAHPDNIASRKVLEKLGYELKEDAQLGRGGIIGADGQLRGYTEADGSPGRRVQYVTTEERLLQHIQAIQQEAAAKGRSGR